MSASPSKQLYNKHFIPLESDPELFTELIYDLGASKSLQFQDVYSIDDPELLSSVPKPVHALILILPTTPGYEKRIALEDASAGIYSANDKITWLSQTINNACGLYAILHAIANSGAKELIGIKHDSFSNVIG
jgi:ubiquitin carboxyl-terminal hydrolase L3